MVLPRRASLRIRVCWPSTFSLRLRRKVCHGERERGRPIHSSSGKQLYSFIPYKQGEGAMFVSYLFVFFFFKELRSLALVYIFFLSSFLPFPFLFVLSLLHSSQLAHRDRCMTYNRSQSTPEAFPSPFPLRCLSHAASFVSPCIGAFVRPRPRCIIAITTAVLFSSSSLRWDSECCIKPKVFVNHAHHLSSQPLRSS
ncbi:uncharacterized protein BDW43DRAFT_81702 [Aspergillus alliaceus]|uniref:uncharacterized protein n=1 Tax=Petromyces alliaceus TaxID=209559 RepID=UPI0012A457C4|nr:uncharacterized protein BDW43DRAFT_81702 [Aspergillus alliaceus]KAB8233582.1 hypothetical protein BDW43DRAFT_81702 [Aspergillus alliaceus]